MSIVRVLAVAVAFLVFGSGVSATDPGDVLMERPEGKAEQTYPAATFPHWVHSIRYRCFACHPAVFSMTTFETKKGTLKQDRAPFVAPKDGTKATPRNEGKPDEAAKKNEGEASEKETKDGTPAEPAKQTATTREKIMHGRQGCGLCHDGKTAFNVEFQVCSRCHVPSEQ